MQMDRRGGSTIPRSIRALVVAHIILGFAFGAIGYAEVGHRAWHHATILSSAALGFSQAALIGLWLGFGETPWKRRCLLGALALVAIWVWFTFAIRGPRALAWRVSNLDFVFIFSAGLLVATIAIVWRRVGWVIGHDSAPLPGAPRARLQFTTLDLFLFTTITALSIGVLTFIRTYILIGRPVDALGLYMLQIAGTTFSATWALLSRRRFYWRLLAAPVAIAVGLPAYYIERRWDLPTVVIAQAAITAATLIVVRRVGYRLYIAQRKPLMTPASPDIPI
jgi:hypothetical protein